MLASYQVALPHRRTAAVINLSPRRPLEAQSPHPIRCAAIEGRDRVECTRTATLLPGSLGKLFRTRSLSANGWHAVGAMSSTRSEEHTSELQSLMRISYAVFCLTNKNTKDNNTTPK